MNSPSPQMRKAAAAHKAAWLFHHKVRERPQSDQRCHRLLTDSGLTAAFGPKATIDDRGPIGR